MVKIKDGEYVVVEPATSGRTYTIQEYQAVVAERDKALAELEKVKAKKTSKKDEEEK